MERSHYEIEALMENMTDCIDTFNLHLHSIYDLSMGERKFFYIFLTPDSADGRRLFLLC
jgi:hypothetical protein